MFAQMRLMLQAERGKCNRLLEERNLVPGRLDFLAGDVLHYATAAGARALGLQNKVGRIEEGLEADVILVRADGINILVSKGAQPAGPAGNRLSHPRRHAEVPPLRAATGEDTWG